MNAHRLGYTSQPTDSTRPTVAGLPVDRLFSEPPADPPGQRAALQALKDFARPGDTVVVAAIDDLAWNLAQLRNIIRDLTALGVDIEFIHEGMTFGTRTPPARQHLAALHALANFESRRAKQRQRAGIDAAKKRGVYRGRQRVLTNTQAAELKRRAAHGTSKTALARELGISRETVYQYLRNATENDQNTAT